MDVSLQGQAIAKNSLLNLVGQAAPLLVAALAIPVLLRAIGTERFGLLTLAWVLVGYFSLFDLGLGRALTQLVSEKVALGQVRDLPAAIWTALALMALLGAACAVGLFLASPWLVYSALKIPVNLRSESLLAVRLLAVSIPLVAVTSGLRGILEAQHRFGFVNTIRVAVSVFTFLGPLAILPFSTNLLPQIVTLVVGRACSCILHLLICLQVMPSLSRQLAFKGTIVKSLINFGSWIAISNVIGPLMVYADRLLIGGILSVAAVAYYTTPFELVTKLWIIPAALTGVLFPTFSATVRTAPDRTIKLFNHAVKVIFLSLFPAILLIVVFARQGLEFWLGHEFAQHSAAVLQWLAIGVFVNSLATVPYALLQAGGRPDLPGKLHLFELPFYLVAAYVAIHKYGIQGAAIVWMGRLAVESIILFVLSRRFLVTGTREARRIAFTMALALAVMGVGTITDGIVVKTVFFVLVLLLFLLGGWFSVLTLEERLSLRDLAANSRRGET
jgi:O-antigen/teichoic acid export membrane protein